MKEYAKYQHVEKFGSDEVEGILEGRCYIFPKLDGTNAHIWFDGVNIRCGSRNRELSPDNDNAGFMNWVLKQEKLKGLAMTYENHHIYGEWLVPHSLKTYREDAWRDFYVFDVVDVNGKHLSFAEWESVAKEHDVSYIPPLRIINNPTLDNIERCLKENQFLVEDGKGNGEGVVVKNYDFVNRFGRQTWAKMVTTEFKEKHIKEMGAPESTGTSYIEEKIVNEFLSEEIIHKVHANIKVQDGWSSKKIPQLLGVVYYDFVRECLWDAIKKNKNPKIDFKVLQRFVNAKIRQTLLEIF